MLIKKSYKKNQQEITMKYILIQDLIISINRMSGLT